MGVSLNNPRETTLLYKSSSFTSGPYMKVHAPHRSIKINRGNLEFVPPSRPLISCASKSLVIRAAATSNDVSFLQNKPSLQGERNIIFPLPGWCLWRCYPSQVSLRAIHLFVVLLATAYTMTLTGYKFAEHPRLDLDASLFSAGNYPKRTVLPEFFAPWSTRRSFSKTGPHRLSPSEGTGRSPSDNGPLQQKTKFKAAFDWFNLHSMADGTV